MARKFSFRFLDPINIGEKVIEGKTKIVFKLPDSPNGGHVLIRSKDRITAGDGARANEMIGKAEISTSTATSIFGLLNECGVPTHYVRRHSAKEFIALHCHMIPIEFVTRRVATGSFLRRHPGVKEGYRFCPPLLEYFFKDDANHDPQWSYEQLVEAKLDIGGVVIGANEIAQINHMTACIFEILERAWSVTDCSLIDMKIEFGVVNATKEIVLADIIDNDSWRLWPSGDRRLQKDKQVYRDMKEITAEGLAVVKKNFEWVAEQAKKLSRPITGRVAILMGSAKDAGHVSAIAKVLQSLGVHVEQHVCSAHKGTVDTLKVLARYEGDDVSTVLIAVAGRSNGLGPVLAGNTILPVINCPPWSESAGSLDAWSSLRLPSGLGCSTVLSTDGAALCAAQMLASNKENSTLWGRLRARQVMMKVSLLQDDAKIQ